MIPTKQRYSTVAVPSPGDSSLRRLVIDALLLLLVCSILTVPVTASSSATEVQVSNWTELKNALESPGVSIVTVTADIAVPEEGSINVTGNITLQSDGNNRCIFQTKPLNPKRSGLFIVLSDGHLVVRNNPMNTGSLTLDGRCNDEDYGPPLVYIFSGGTFTMSGGHITNCSARSSNYAGGCVCVYYSGPFTMK
ncbi:MAG: hypothetical protein O0X93_07020 [Methanocorpusculum sp.]|nr:hypothetical protein [Methanocorpusculum sp.]